MKKNVKVLSVLLTTLFATSSISMPASAANDSFAARFGIKLDTKYYKKIGYTREYKNDIWLSGNKIGTSRHYIIFATNKNKVGQRFQNVALYYSEMIPRRSASWIGSSDSLQITSNLNHDKDHYRGYKLTQFSEPKAKSASTSYSIGVGMDGISGSISASFGGIKITNTTNSDCYNVRYAYSVISDILKDGYTTSNSDQYGAYYYITDGKPFNYPLTVTTKFDLFDYYGRPKAHNVSDTMKWSVNLSS